MLWNNETICAPILRKEQRAIHMLVHDVEKKRNTIVSGVYAIAQQRNKDSFWSHFLQLNTVIDLPWCLIRDFNELANPSERKGEQRYPNTKFARLNNFTNSINAICTLYGIPIHVEEENSYAFNL